MTKNTENTIIENAQAMLAMIETRNINNETRYFLADSRADWMHEVMHAAHGSMLPDNFRYAMVADCLSALIDADSIDDARDTLLDLVPIYNGELTAWLASHGSRIQWVDEAIENDGNLENLLQALSAGYFLELSEVFELTVAAIEEVES